MDETLLSSMTAVMQALAREKPKGFQAEPEISRLCCSEGHELRLFSPAVDGFYCYDCGDDLEEGGQCFRCFGCGGLTYCRACIGAAPPQISPRFGTTANTMADFLNMSPEQADITSSYLNAHDELLAFQLAQEFELEGQELQSALSPSRICPVTHSDLDVLDADDMMGGAAAGESLQFVKRCFICGVHTRNPISLQDSDCMHVACSLTCLHRLHSQWLDIKHELNQLDAALL